MNASNPDLRIPREIKTGPDRWFVLTLTVVATAVFLTMARTAGALDDPLADPVGSALMLLLLSVGWLAAFRLSRARLLVDERGLTARNVFSSFRYSWDEIKSISTGEGLFFDARMVGSPARLWTRDGAIRYIVGIQPPFFIELGLDSPGRRACEALNDARALATQNDGLLPSRSLGPARPA